jgi:hypothetical protein
MARVHFYSAVLGLTVIPLGLLAVASDTTTYQVVFGLLAVVALGASRWEIATVAEYDDRIAARLVQDRHKRDFILYLRPFSTDDSVVANPVYQPYANPNEPQTIGFEKFLIRSLGRRSRVVKIHSETQMIDGIGGIRLSDDEWPQAFQDLSERARVIVMTPGASDGVLVELKSPKDRTFFTNACSSFGHDSSTNRHGIWPG